MMNEDNLKSEIDSLLPKSMALQPEMHPLHMLDNQADPETKPKTILQKTIRTYESDVADALSNKKTTVSTITIAENKKKEREEVTAIEEKGDGRKKAIIIIISIVFIIAGLAGGYYLYLKSPLAVIAPVAVQQKKAPSIITPEVQKALPIGTMGSNQINKLVANALKNEKTTNGSIHEFIPTQIVNNANSRVPVSDFIKNIGLNIPDITLRSLTKEWMMGVYNSESQNYPFIILKTNFFQNAFAGMLQWEPMMPDEFAEIFNYKTKNEIENAEGTSTVKSFFTIHGQFTDKTILNRDIREFVNDNGEVLILYSFVDKDTIIITTSEVTLKSLIEKIENQTFIRYN